MSNSNFDNVTKNEINNDAEEFINLKNSEEIKLFKYEINIQKTGEFLAFIPSAFDP